VNTPVNSTSNVIILLYNFQTGGAQRSLIRIANGIYQSGNKVAVCALSGAGPLRDKIHQNIEVIDLKSERLSKSTFSLARVISKNRSASYISSLIGPNLLLLMLKLFFFSGLKVFIREASTPSVELKESIKDILLYKLAKLLYPFSNGVIAVSKGVKKDLMTYLGLPESKIEIIYNPVIDRPLESLPKQAKDFRQTGASLHLGFLGRVDPVKQIEDQIEILSQLRQHSIDAHLFIGGPISNDSYHKRLLRLIKERDLESRVKFMGNIVDIERFMKGIDILLLTSRYEGLPSVLIEALLYGKTVISYDCKNGPSEILDDGRFGFLVEPEGNKTAKIVEAIANQSTPVYITADLENHLQMFSVETVNTKIMNMTQEWA
jgi:glycosyltransferase involved in cell wall biosynthesis